MSDPAADESPQIDQPTANMREVALWIVLFLALIGVAFYCGQLIEELTGKKSVAKIALVAIALVGSMIVRGGMWLAKRLRRDARTARTDSASLPDG